MVDRSHACSWPGTNTTAVSADVSDLPGGFEGKAARLFSVLFAKFFEQRYGSGTYRRVTASLAGDTRFFQSLLETSRRVDALIAQEADAEADADMYTSTRTRADSSTPFSLLIRRRLGVPVKSLGTVWKEAYATISYCRGRTSGGGAPPSPLPSPPPAPSAPRGKEVEAHTTEENIPRAPDSQVGFVEKL